MEKEKKNKGKRKFTLRALMIATCALCLVFAASIAAISLFPYEIYVEGEEVCSVKSREDATAAITKAIGSMAVEGTKVKVVKSEKDVDVVRSKSFDSSDVISSDAAAECLGEKLVCTDGENCEQKGITVVSSKVGEKEFTPDPEYVRDDSMPAGSARTLEEGQNGLGMCLYTYTVVDGNVDDSNEEIIEVLDEGKSEKIAKGTVGLPPGENWETYEGDPIFSSGAALVATAKKYKGAPYKWGGTNLKTGVSCIGFVKAIYAKYGIKIPMSHPLLKKFGVGVSYSDAQPGDIICYKEHTGIYIGGGKMIDAASNRGVGIAKVRPGNVVTVRRVPRS